MQQVRDRIFPLTALKNITYSRAGRHEQQESIPVRTLILTAVFFTENI